ncbi:ZIP family metal transporter [Candidatus Margulisiibacteriota bacterium]
MLIYILIATVLVSLISLTGVIFLSFKDEFLKQIMESLISFASGGLLGGAFIHLLPESVEMGGAGAFTYVIFGLLFFFVLEKFLKWRHCHEFGCDIHAFTYLNLIGDGVHNFIDGIIIAAAFVVDIRLGIVTTIAVALHEIPQEVGDFAVLIYGGFTKARALFFNLVSASFAIVGALAAYFLLSYVQGIQPMLLAFTAGGFIYIALADLVPELHKKWGLAESVTQTILMVTGIGLMLIMKIVLGA